uniref:Bet v I/Major latex protein domain-containing protein n=1 Tax=Brassica campestris TaxID=3711 RepID=M4D7A1_BRACM
MAESSSLLGELEVEVEIKAPAAEFYHIPPRHVSKATPGNVICTTESGAKFGSIISWNYMHDGKAKVAKERIEVVEPEKKLIKFKVLEGDLMEEFKSFLITIQVTPKQGGNGSIVKWHFEYKNLMRTSLTLKLCSRSLPI